MENKIEMNKLLELRKLTSAIASILHHQLLEYITTLKPLFRPFSVLGSHTRPGADGIVKGSDKAFAELKSAYIKIAGSKRYNQPRVLESPIPITTLIPEIIKMEYPHETTVNGVTKTVTVISPLRWVLTYTGFTPAHLRSLFAQGDYVNDRQMQEALQHIMVMNSVVTRNTGLSNILSSLGYTTSTGRLAEFGDLPFTFLNAPVTTKRPPDNIMLQVIEISGSPVFEEVVRVEDITNMKTPLKDQLIAEAKKIAGHLLKEE